MRPTTWCRVWTFSFVVLAAVATAPAAESLADYFPDGALGSVELSGLGSLVDKIENSEIPRFVEESEGYKKFADSDQGRKLRGVQAVVEGQLGFDYWTALRRLVGDQAFLAVYPPAEGSSQPDGVLLVRLADKEIGPLIKQKLAPFVQLAGDQVQSEERDGAWRLRSRDNKVHAALHGRWVIVSSVADKLDAVLKAVSQPDPPTTATLADASAWKGVSVKAQTGDTWATMCVDLTRLHALLNQDRLLPAKVDNPLVSLLLGGLMECAARAPKAQATLLVAENDFALSLKVDQPTESLDAAHRTLFAPRVSAQSVLTPNLPRRLASLEFSRRWADWYKSRDQLLEAKVLPEFDKFETGLATFLPGKDFAEDVLALLKEPLTFVAAKQTYPHLDGHPGVQLPAFAVVIELKDPQKGADLFNVFYQTVTSVTNIEAGKYGRQPWVIGSESFQGVQLAFAKYLQTPKGTELPIVYNFQPSSALVGNRYVATTSLELCRDLVATLQKKPIEQPVRTGVDVNFEFNLDPVVAAELLWANRAGLEALGIRQGKSATQVKQEMDAGQSLLRAFTPWQVRTIVHEQAVELRLTGGWQ